MQKFRTTTSLNTNILLSTVFCFLFFVRHIIIAIPRGLNTLPKYCSDEELISQCHIDKSFGYLKSSNSLTNSVNVSSTDSNWPRF